MKVSTQPYKGARDFYPEDKRMQEWMFNKWKSVIERFGYEGYDAPILEPTDLYLMKGSQEIIQEQTYTFKDRDTYKDTRPITDQELHSCTTKERQAAAQHNSYTTH